MKANNTQHTTNKTKCVNELQIHSSNCATLNVCAGRSTTTLYKWKCNIANSESHIKCVSWM